MYETYCPLPAGRCSDLDFRLAVYEAGHALTARALGFTILTVKMRPRPPVMESDKVVRGNAINGLLSVLENRCIELFGGQIAEAHACKSHSCCDGDVARIDELCRLIAGLEGSGRMAEDIWFELEDVADEIFAREHVREAIVPLAEFLFGEVEEGRVIIPGTKVEAMLDELLGARADKSRSRLLASLLGR